jgi:hypothetical protein
MNFCSSSSSLARSLSLGRVPATAADSINSTETSSLEATLSEQAAANTVQKGKFSSHHSRKPFFRTRNLLGKWKSHSQSVDIPECGGALESGLQLSGGLSDPGVLDDMDSCNVSRSGSPGFSSAMQGTSQGAGGAKANGDGHHLPPLQKSKSKSKWSEHVWSK